MTEFYDADWGACAFSGRSLTGYCVFLGGCLVSWKTKKQKIISKSLAESGYRPMSQTTSELVWIDGIVEDLTLSIPHLVTLSCDNKVAHYIGQNPVYNERTMHLKLDCHYVREHIEAGFIVTTYIKSSLQLACIITKSLFEAQHTYICLKLGLCMIDKVQLERG